MVGASSRRRGLREGNGCQRWVKEGCKMGVRPPKGRVYGVCCGGPEG